MATQFLVSNFAVAVTTLVVGSIVILLFQLKKFYSHVRTFPPGPLPLPVFGNIFAFATKGQRSGHQVITGYSKKYGPIFTFWFGQVPQVIIADSKGAREALTRSEFAGRPSFGEFTQVFFGKDSTDIALCDYSREWEVLRKVCQSAIRKFAVNERLPLIVDREVKKVLSEIKNQKECQPFDPNKHLTLLMMSLLATCVFGQEFTMSDPDFINLKRTFELENESVTTIFLMVFLPFLKFFFRKDFQNLLTIVKVTRGYVSKQYKEHLDTYSDAVVRDIVDGIILAKKEVEAESASDSKYLTDSNIANAVIEIFTGGAETTKAVILWVLMFLAEHPEYQREIREEIETALGSDDIATVEHRRHCNLLQAFILETIRVRPIIPLTVPHKTIRDTEINGHKIKSNTAVLISLEACLSDPEIWPEPSTFRPERFLDENHNFLPKPSNYFVPFSGGRRMCLGEKLALTNVFLILTGLIQQTKGHLFAFPNGPGSVDMTPKPPKGPDVQPKPFTLVLLPVA